MDSITQAALGAVVGEAVLGQKLGNRALVWGAALGTLPDLDVLLSPLLDTAGELIQHRGASHSLLVMVIASFVMAPLLAKLWHKDGVNKARAGWFVFWVWSTHVLIDCFTVYGTSVLWPFSDHRVGFNNLFIIDVFYTGPLLATIAWLAWLRKPEQRHRRMRLCLWGLGISTAYVVLSLIAKGVASYGFGGDLERRGIAYEKRMEAPTPFNIFLWRAVVDCDDNFLVGYKSVFESPSAPVRWTVYPKGHSVAAPFHDAREVETIKWFSQGYWIARPQTDGVWLGDLRFNESYQWDSQAGTVENRVAFCWLFMPDTTPDKLHRVDNERVKPSDTLRRLIDRIFGDTSEWDLDPRLVGIPAREPEPLRVIE